MALLYQLDWRDGYIGIYSGYPTNHGYRGFQIFKAESTGPIADKIVPRIKDTAKILYITYISITLLQIILLVAGHEFL